ncbi:MAG: hypothetical protein ACLQQ4_14245 [Bacteroidia bacterium]
MLNKDTKALAILITGILLVATILRLIHPLQIPYTYDELSALARTHYNSFSELIDKGVIIDAHPAGVQVFIYYWTRLFGYNELVVKLPFIVFGILAVYYIYKLGQTWFNSTVGLVCAAYLATLQYTIMYSQVIRPYSSGLFLSLAMVYYWNKIIFKPGEVFYKNALLYVLFSALCAYNHHLSLLFAAIVGITGLFFISKKYLVKYIVAGISIFVLYIPHLHIFFYQLKVGGVGGPNGWLGTPRYTFLWEYIYYVFQFSRSVLSVVIAIFLFGIYYTFRSKLSNIKYLFISLCWFLIPLLTGFFYSLWVNPILQYSVLIFSFPFFLFCLFGWLPELPVRNSSILLTVICVVNIFSLVTARKHYTLFYKSPYEQTILLNDSLVKTLGKDNYGCIMQGDDSDKNVSNYFIHKYHADTSFYWTDNLGCFITYPSNYTRLIGLMEKQQGPYFAFGGTSQFDPIVLYIISDKYPYLVKRWDFYGGCFFLFSKKPVPEGPTLYSFESLDDFEDSAKYWSKADKAFLSDTIHFSGKHSYKLDEQHEWAPGFTCSLNDMSWGKNDVIKVSLELYPMDTLNNVDIVSTLESNGKTIDWRSTPVNKFIADTARKQWVKVYHTIKLQDIDIHYPEVLLKVYIWNRGKKKFYMDDFSVETMKGNPVIYGLFQKI